MATETGTINCVRERNEESCRGDDIGNAESESKLFPGQIEFHNLPVAASAVCFRCRCRCASLFTVCSILEIHCE